MILIVLIGGAVAAGVWRLAQRRAPLPEAAGSPPIAPAAAADSRGAAPSESTGGLPATPGNAPPVGTEPRSAPLVPQKETTQAPPGEVVLPPLPLSATPPARPLSIVQEVYAFAATHPEVLRYVPCYCGCEANGHRSNLDCFVAAQDAAGRVSRWNAHGLG